MSTLRLISLPMHGALEMLSGIGLMAAPFALGFGPAGLIISVALGALLFGLALGLSDDEPGRGLSIGAHVALDRGLAFGLLAAALVLAAYGEALAGAIVTIAALLQIALTATTSYVGRR
jgi:hypothetical protein